MATALAKGVGNTGLVLPDNLIASDPVSAGREAFAQVLGCETTGSNADVLAKAKVIVLAFKPHQLNEATEPVRDQFDESHLVISILAGVRLAKLAEACGGQARVVRVMPNTPALVGEGACGYALGQAATADDGALVKRLPSFGQPAARPVVRRHGPHGEPALGQRDRRRPQQNRPEDGAAGSRSGLC